MENPVTTGLQLALIGYGEVGQIFAREWLARGVAGVAVYDILFDDPRTGPEQLRRAREGRVRAGADAADAAHGARVVVSAVTAASAAEVARQAAGYLRPGQIFFDINSASPATKRASALHVEPSGALFVEGAVMAPVAPSGLRVPILAGGPAAATAARVLNAIGMNVRPVSSAAGRASAMKLCRSVMIKGIEALIVDCAAAARAWDVETEVFASLQETFPSIDFARLAATMAERVARHGVRRAAEMREAASMLEELGIDGALEHAVADAQERGAARPDPARSGSP